jgi:hypothetical protein
MPELNSIPSSTYSQPEHTFDQVRTGDTLTDDLARNIADDNPSKWTFDSASHKLTNKETGKTYDTSGQTKLTAQDAKDINAG